MYYIYIHIYMGTGMCNTCTQLKGIYYHISTIYKHRLMGSQSTKLFNLVLNQTKLFSIHV